jgi:hypothetical protein
VGDLRLPAAFDLWTEQQVLFAVVRGGWNELTARDYSLAYQKTVKPLLGNDWAHIVYLDDWGLGSPAIEPIISQLATWAVSQRLRYFAQVYSPNMVKQFQLDRMLVSPIKTCEKQLFAEQNEAFAWLASKGFSTNSASLMPKIA